MISPRERESYALEVIVTDFNIQSLMEKVVRSFDPAKAAGIDARIQFHLTGRQAGDWVATIRDQKLSVEPGSTTDPTLMFSADTQDVLDVFSGKLDPMRAYMQGKVQFKGDMGLAMRLVSMFRKLE
jgi:putative sterol carrier protein